MRNALLLPLLLCFAAAPTAAQEPPGPPGPPPELARALELAGAGDLEAAIAELESQLDGEMTEPAQALLGALYVEAGKASEALEQLRPMARRDDAQPAVLFNAGRAALAAGEAAEALGYLERAARGAPNSPAGRALGMLLARQGRCEDAYRLLKPWASTRPDDLEARRVAALCAVQLERPGDAEQLLSDLPQDQPAVRLLWGRLLVLKADPWGALATLRPLLDDAPEAMAVDVRRTMAEAYASVGEAAKAVELLEGRIGSNSALALQLGQAQYQSGDLESALQTLEPFATRLLSEAKDGSDPRGHEVSLVVEYARLLVTSGRQAEALPYLELATRVDPGRKQSWHQLGQALAATGRRDEAQVALKKFQEIVQNEVPTSLKEVQLEKDLEDPTGRELRDAMTAMAQGRFQEALEIARREQSFSPEDIRPHLVEARVLQFAGQAGEALEKADQIVQAAPQSADAVYLRGIILMGLEETEAAERDLRQALELTPEHTAALNDLAVLLMSRGDDDEARTLLERALEIRPDDTLAAENLGKLEG